MKARYFISLVLLVVFIFNSLVFCMVLVSRQYEAKCEMKKRLLDSDLADVTLLTLSGSEYKSLLNGEEEFEYKGELYDVISIRQQEGNYLVKAISDKKEKKALQTMKEIAEQSDPVKKTNRALLLFLPLYTSEAEKSFIVFYPAVNSSETKFVNNYLSLIQEHTTPPPKQAC